MVSAIIPARNEEASIARAVESVAAQAEVMEVIVVNDQSTDGTGAILKELAARISKLKVLDGGELPVGWVGKNYAASVGAASAQGDWLLFTDADTDHYPCSARKALSDAAEHGAALVSYSPEQEMETWWERALIPFIYCRLTAMYSYARVNDPELPDAAANGQYLLIRREVYRSVGGHEAVAREVLEDVALARRVKEAGNGIYFAAGGGIVRTRMYRSFRGMWQGWTKNLHLLSGGRAAGVVLQASSLAAVGALLLLWAASEAKDPALGRVLAALILGMIAGGHLRYGIELRRNFYPLSYIRYYVAGVCLYSSVLIASWWKNTRGKVTWKGREYSVRTP